MLVRTLLKFRSRFEVTQGESLSNLELSGVSLLVHATSYPLYPMNTGLVEEAFCPMITGLDRGPGCTHTGVPTLTHAVCRRVP
jgi:hypothetical protein